MSDELPTTVTLMHRRPWLLQPVLRFAFVAERSAAQGERDGFFWLGICFRDGEGCERDIEKAKASFLVSAELGDVHGMLRLGELCDRNDAQRFVWLGTAAVSGDCMAFLDEFGDQIRNFNSGTGCKGHVCHRSSFERSS